MNAIFAPAGAVRIEIAETFLNTEGARAGFIVLAGMLVSFGFIRMSTRLMRSPKVPWWPGSVTPGGLHIHHLVFGIVMMMVAGFLMFAFQPESPWLEILAATFGIGVGLTLDEFALWLYLDDVYWAEEGRRSVDAIIVATILAGGHRDRARAAGRRRHRRLIAWARVDDPDQPGRLCGHGVQGKDLDGDLRAVHPVRRRDRRDPARQAQLALRATLLQAGEPQGEAGRGAPAQVRQARRALSALAGPDRRRSLDLQGEAAEK